MKCLVTILVIAGCAFVGFSRLADSGVISSNGRSAAMTLRCEMAGGGSVTLAPSATDSDNGNLPADGYAPVSFGLFVDNGTDQGGSTSGLLCRFSQTPDEAVTTNRCVQRDADGELLFVVETFEYDSHVYFLTESKTDAGWDRTWYKAPKCNCTAQVPGSRE